MDRQMLSISEVAGLGSMATCIFQPSRLLLASELNNALNRGCLFVAVIVIVFSTALWRWGLSRYLVWLQMALMGECVECGGTDSEEKPRYQIARHPIYRGLALRLQNASPRAPPGEVCMLLRSMTPAAFFKRCALIIVSQGKTVPKCRDPHNEAAGERGSLQPSQRMSLLVTGRHDVRYWHLADVHSTR
jgi:hypothetical protein